MITLGLNYNLHNASASLIRDNEIIAACEEERLNRTKHYGGFPEQAIDYCLQTAGVRFRDVEHIGFYWKPWKGLLKRGRLFLAHMPHTLSLFSDHQIPRGTLSTLMSHFSVSRFLRKKYGTIQHFHFLEHHLCHAASSFLCSPFDESVIASIDLAGEIESTYFAIGRGKDIRYLRSQDYPHSLGNLYATVTQYLGFIPNLDEYKVMGLSAYGEPRFIDAMRKIVKKGPKGSFRLDLDYFIHHWGQDRWFSDRFIQLFGPPCQDASQIMDKRFLDIACSCQRILEEMIFNVLNHVYDLMKVPRLCLAGGVALNGTMNGKIREHTHFDEIFIQPASHDAGCSLGAAMYLSAKYDKSFKKVEMKSAYLGPEYSENRMVTAFQKHDLKFTHVQNIENCTAELIARGCIVGWFQGRMEWGPRALGNRSILADPRDAGMKDRVNQVIKFREEFRPFAPSVLVECYEEYFDMREISRFMLQICIVKQEKRSMIPAVTHVDGTARPQVVEKDQHPESG